MGFGTTAIRAVIRGISPSRASSEALFLRPDNAFAGAADAGNPHLFRGSAHPTSTRLALICRSTVVPVVMKRPDADWACPGCSFGSALAAAQYLHDATHGPAPLEAESALSAGDDAWTDTVRCSGASVPTGRNISPANAISPMLVPCVLFIYSPQATLTSRKTKVVAHPSLRR